MSGVALSVAGLDPTGGAGLIADLRTFAAEGVWGCGVATALTFQNTVEVEGFEAVEERSIDRQLGTLLADVEIDAIKVGMLATPEACMALARNLAPWQGKLARDPAIVLDPVITASTGAPLSTSGLAETILAELIPLATLVTPNFDEVEALIGARPNGAGEATEAGRELIARGARAVLVTGGDVVGDEVVDILVEGDEVLAFAAPRIETRHSHGTGCVLSSAIAAGLALGDDLVTAIERGRSRVRLALKNGLQLGRGAGPVDPLGAGLGG